jgi:predicted lipoprotein with Yx(FWY)xxD motif
MPITRVTRTLLRASMLAGALALAACGSGTSGADAGSSADTTVAVRSTDGGSVLTDAQGRTLYESDQEDGEALCTSSDCTAIWAPLTVSGDAAPTGPSEVTGSLSTIDRSDGSRQVTLDGKPLYTFSFDHAPGETGGDGQRDAFGGTEFTWHAATPDGAMGGAPSAPPATGYDY